VETDLPVSLYTQIYWASMGPPIYIGGNLKWKYYHFEHTFNSDKKHDTGTWSIIHSEKGKINYVSAIIPPDHERLLIHLGGEIGSLCNKLQSKQYDDRIKMQLQKREEEIRNMNVYELFEKYKEKFHKW
jgi:hypothetical protein